MAVSSRGAETVAVRATPAARRLAKERGVDLARVQAGVRMDVITETAVIRYLAEQKK
jgi:pyruvate/2-oxoglutarate dehydrogenase complex dihydrolipoamide acyltransferase (E2) component